MPLATNVCRTEFCLQMAITLSDQLRDAGLRVATAAKRDFAPTLNAALASLFEGFYVGPGAMLAPDGQRSANFESVIALESPKADRTIPADAVACTIFTRCTLDAASLVEGHQRIAQVKTLPKKRRPAPGQSNITLGLIVAARAVWEIEAVAIELRTLNEAGR